MSYKLRNIKIYYYLKRLQVPLGGLYDRIRFAQQYHVALGEHGALRRRLYDGLLVGLDDRMYLQRNNNNNNNGLNERSVQKYKTLYTVDVPT